MVGVNVPIPVPVAYYSFGGWKASLFGDPHIYGPEGIHFYTRGKVVTSRWPDPATSQGRSRLPADALTPTSPSSNGCRTLDASSAAHVARDCPWTCRYATRARLQLLAELRALDELADAGLATSSSPSTTTWPRSRTTSGDAGHLGALVEVVVRLRVLRRRRDRVLALRVEDDDVGVGAERDRALARVEAEELRRVRRQQLDHPVERDPALADAEVVDHLQPVLEARAAVRDLREVVLADRLLAVPEEGAVVGRDRRQRRRCAPRSRARPGSPCRAAAARRRTSRPRSPARRGRRRR